MENTQGTIEIKDIKEIIISALDYYDRNTTKYKKYVFNNNIILIENNKEIKFILDNNETFTASYELAGYYDITNNIWIWGWLLPIDNKKTLLSRDLLSYGLKLDIDTINNDQIFIKNILLNSRYIVTDNIGMDINLAIFSYILKEKILFIYPHKNDNIIRYYFIID